MNYQVIHNYFRADRKKVVEVFMDVDFFLRHVKQTEQIIDNWYFYNVLSFRHWECLKNYNWLEEDENHYLHKGILTILLFAGYQCLENKIRLQNKQLTLIFRSLYNFNPSDKTTRKLLQKVLDAFVQVKKKQRGIFNPDSNNEIYGSISWTIKNIILSESPMIKRIQDKNQR